MVPPQGKAMFVQPYVDTERERKGVKNSNINTSNIKAMHKEQTKKEILNIPQKQQIHESIPILPHILYQIVSQSILPYQKQQIHESTPVLPHILHHIVSQSITSL